MQPSAPSNTSNLGKSSASLTLPDQEGGTMWLMYLESTPMSEDVLFNSLDLSSPFSGNICSKTPKKWFVGLHHGAVDWTTVWTLISCTRVPLWVLTALLQTASCSCILGDRPGGCSRCWLKKLSFCHKHGRPGRSFQFLTSAYPIAGCCGKVNPELKGSFPTLFCCAFQV